MVRYVPIRQSKYKFLALVILELGVFSYVLLQEVLDGVAVVSIGEYVGLFC